MRQTKLPLLSSRVHWFTQLVVIAVSTLIITSSIILFISDRGNIISLANEQVHGWKNPTFNDVQLFISLDETDKNSFITKEYECKQFSIDLIRHARTFGFRAGYVSLQNPMGDDHAIVCFQTTDNGLVFVEPQNDYLMTKQNLDGMLETGLYQPGPSEGDSDRLRMPLSNYIISWYMII